MHLHLGRNYLHKKKPSCIMLLGFLCVDLKTRSWSGLANAEDLDRFFIMEAADCATFIAGSNCSLGNPITVVNSEDLLSGGRIERHHVSVTSCGDDKGAIGRETGSSPDAHFPFGSEPALFFSCQMVCHLEPVATPLHER